MSLVGIYVDSWTRLLVQRCGRSDSSDALIALVNEPRLSRPQVVKRLWEYIKANQLQDPSDGRYILCDEPMRAVFHTDKLHMFT